MQAPNILLMDEPANDLDVQTLTILEDYLRQFRGAVITVSHDRYFLDKVVDTIFEFRDDGTIKKYLGSFSDYAEQSTADSAGDKQPASKAVPETKSLPVIKNTGNKKLKFSFREQREYDTIESDIAGLEEHIRGLETMMQNESSDYVKLQEIIARKETAEKELGEKMDRWVYLNDLAEQIEAAKNDK
jgi:ATP-binding cassette subfamily F protein uup